MTWDFDEPDLPWPCPQTWVMTKHQVVPHLEDGLSTEHSEDGPVTAGSVGTPQEEEKVTSSMGHLRLLSP